MGLESVIQSEKSEREKQIPHANTYMWNLRKKMVLINLGAGKESRCRGRERNCGHKGKG